MSCTAGRRGLVRPLGTRPSISSPRALATMSKHDEDDEDKTGYKVAEKVSMDKILKQDAEDESLRKYKESLGLSANIFARTFATDPTGCRYGL